MALDKFPDAFAFTPQTNAPLQSVRMSNPVHITGIVGATDIYADGSLGSSYCVSSAGNCGCDVSVGFVGAPGVITTNNYVCVRHVSAPVANALSKTVLHVGGGAAPFLVMTGPLIAGGCTLDVDGNGGIDALTDGLLLIRAMFGLTVTAVTNGAIGAGSPTRSTWAQIQPYLNGSCGATFAP